MVLLGWVLGFCQYQFHYKNSNQGVTAHCARSQRQHGQVLMAVPALGRPNVLRGEGGQCLTCHRRTGLPYLPVCFFLNFYNDYFFQCIYASYVFLQMLHTFSVHSGIKDT